jgi:hypothetical protein
MHGKYDYETVMGQIGFSEGKHYWEITIDSYNTERDLFIGVCNERAPVHGFVLEKSDTAWGWFCSMARKMSTNVSEKYGQHVIVGEKIGVLLEFRDGVGSLTFYQKNRSLGPAFTDIPAGTYFPCATLISNRQSDVQVSINSNAKLPSA